MAKLHALPDEQFQQQVRKGTLLDTYSILFFVMQVGLIILFAAVCDFPPADEQGLVVGYALRSGNYYTFYNNIALMVFIGFGYMMSSYKKFGFSAIGYSFSIAAFALQWSTLTQGTIHKEF